MNHLDTLQPAHPRLLITRETWPVLQARRAAEPELATFLHTIEAEARALVPQPPVKYEKTGIRLLHVSRRVLRRVLFFAMGRHLTGDAALAQRAADEMLAAAAFEDWNPSHYLDVAEMCAALAIGYDWLYDDLTPETRATVRRAIVEKALQPTLASPHLWITCHHNWNQVCHSGVLLGALAIAEDEPELAARIATLAHDNIHAGLSVYEPDGVYPEGPMYWSYGTAYQVLMIAAIESALGTDWNLTASRGFLPSAYCNVHLTGPSGRYFNFCDAIEDGGTKPELFWFARRLNQPGLLEFERQRLADYAALPIAVKEGEATRLLPLAALWWPDSEAEDAPHLPLAWQGDGLNPVAAFRTAWREPRAAYLTVKGGVANVNHGHMDAGSFVYEADGVRWASDLGMQDYHSLEQKGIKLSSYGQDVQRWTIFRLNNFSHSTLTIDGHLHRSDGRAALTRCAHTADAKTAVLDLSAVFGASPSPATVGVTTAATFPQLARRVTRGFAFRPTGAVVIRDELDGLTPGVEVRWALVTAAKVVVDGPTARLEQDGQTLHVQIHAPADEIFGVIPADPPPDDFNVANPGFSMLLITAHAPAAGALQLGVTLRPGSVAAANERLATTPLAGWP